MFLVNINNIVNIFEYYKNCEEKYRAKFRK